MNVPTHSTRGLSACWEGFQGESGFARHPQEVTQAEGSRKGPARQGLEVGTGTSSPVRPKCLVCRVEGTFR